MYTCELNTEVLKSRPINYKKKLEKELLEKKFSAKGFLNALNWPSFKKYSFVDLCDIATDLMENLEENEVYYQGVSVQKDENGEVVFYVHLNRMTRATSEADDVPESYMGFKVIKITEGKFYF